MTWASVQLAGLVLDAFGALLLGIRDMNLLSNWISRQWIGPYVRRQYTEPAKAAVRKLDDQEQLTPDDEGFDLVVDLLVRASPMRDTEPLEETEVVSKIEVFEDREMSGATRWIEVTTPGGSKVVDGAHRPSDRLRHVAQQKVERLEDYSRGVPALIMVVGFCLQIVAFTVIRNAV